MPKHTLAFNPVISYFGGHDPSAVLFENGVPIYGVEEERFTREKHALSTFPEKSIQSCLQYADFQISDLDKIIIPWIPKDASKTLPARVRQRVWSTDSHLERLQKLERYFETRVLAHSSPLLPIRKRLREIGGSLPPLEMRSHHRSHAASAFYPTAYDQALIVTADASGEYDSTVVWHGKSDGVERIRTYKWPNSLGHFYSIVTEYLGFRAFNGEGKVMGLAPYGNWNQDIADELNQLISGGVDYDVTPLTKHGVKKGVEKLERVFSRPQNEKDDTNEFSQWQKDLAYTAQKKLEEIIKAIVGEYLQGILTKNVCLAGGVSLNCKMNKEVMEMDQVGDLFIQPVANDAGIALGAGMLDYDPDEIGPLSDVYLGPEYTNSRIESLLKQIKVEYERPDNLERQIAESLAEGKIVAWFQGRLEMGPRALGNRSILADPRTVESRDRVNKFVKHREEWRPFAPSILEEAADDFLINGEPSPFMIKTFDIQDGKRDSLQAVIHPKDGTTRPQTVKEKQNSRYYSLIKKFEKITGVPAVLNTSFNDHGEPIINTPSEAIKGFYGMGIDTLVMNDFVIHKSGSRPESATRQ